MVIRPGDARRASPKERPLTDPAGMLPGTFDRLILKAAWFGKLHAPRTRLLASGAAFENQNEVIH
jgi:hypothetical protein